MSTESPGSVRRRSGPTRTVRIIGILLVVAGAILLVAGVATWITVQNQLADEKITVSDDADWFAGEPVDGPLTAYAQAEVIEKHALESSGGKTYAELARDDPARKTVQDASFLRASLFTSVVSFGVAAMAAALGVVIALIGYALMSVSRQLTAVALTA
jgi:ABC-type Fe3+ transport system permease subunit